MAIYASYVRGLTFAKCSAGEKARERVFFTWVVIPGKLSLLRIDVFALRLRNFPTSYFVIITCLQRTILHQVPTILKPQFKKTNLFILLTLHLNAVIEMNIDPRKIMRVILLTLQPEF